MQWKINEEMKECKNFEAYLLNYLKNTNYKYKEQINVSIEKDKT